MQSVDDEMKQDGAAPLSAAPPLEADPVSASAPVAEGFFDEPHDGAAGVVHGSPREADPSPVSAVGERPAETETEPEPEPEAEAEAEAALAAEREDDLAAAAEGGGERVEALAEPTVIAPGPPSRAEGAAAPSVADGVHPLSELRLLDPPEGVGSVDRGAEGEPLELRRVRQGRAAAAQYIPISSLADDEAFSLRSSIELSRLATELARLGQLFPIDVRPVEGERYQVISGFRRVAALRFLKRERVLARVHEKLSDDDALLLALAAMHVEPVEREELVSLKERLEAQGRVAPAVRDLLEKALIDGDLSPEAVTEEVDADELAIDVTRRLGDINQDLSLLADVFHSLERERRAELIAQLRYSAELVAYLEGL